MITSRNSILATTGLSGSIIVQQFTPPKSAVATTVSILASGPSKLLLAANVNRLGASLYNNSSNNCFVNFGASASSGSFSRKLNGSDYFTIPFNYIGTIHGAWDGAPSGAMLVSEFV